MSLSTLQYRTTFAAISTKRIEEKDAYQDSKEKVIFSKHSKTWHLRHEEPRLVELESSKSQAAQTNTSNAGTIKTKSDHNDSIFENPHGSQGSFNKTLTRGTSPPVTIGEQHAIGEQHGGVWVSDARLGYVVKELMQTEASFLSSLQMLRNHVLEPYLRRCEEQRCRCFALEVLSKAASRILKSHEPLLDLKGLALLDRIASVLQDTQIYVDYYVNADAFLYLVLNPREVFPASFTEYVLQSLENRNTLDNPSAKLDLSILLLVQKPMARIVKYQLLIAQLLIVYPESEAIKCLLGSIKASVQKINTELEKIENCTEITRSLSEFISFEQTIGQCPLHYGQLRQVFVASLAWPSFKRSWKISKTVVLLLLFQTNLIVCDLRSTRRRKKPLLVIPYDTCEVVTKDDFDGGLTIQNEQCTKIRFFYKDCEYEVILRFHNREALNSLLSLVQKNQYGRCRLGIECFLPKSIAPSDILIESNSVEKKKYQQCYFRKVMRYDLSSPLEWYLKSRSLRRLRNLQADGCK